FITTLEERGFPNSSPLTGVVDNGTFVNNAEISPELGFSRDGLLTDRAKRRKYGLSPELRPPTRDDERGRAKNMLRHDSDWVDADLTVSTDADQTAIAPGLTVSDVVQGDRRTVHFLSDAPINHFFSIQSARYQVQRAKYRDVDLAVYYDASYPQNVPRMLRAMQTSLEAFEEKLGPYQFHQARILSFPAYADFAQSFANTVPYSENLGFIVHHTDPGKVDFVTYVTAHEIAHQWWGHQLVPSEQQGATMLVESFAQYSALLVMERMYGKEQVRRFTKYELDEYLKSRGSDAREEQPLGRVENQSYVHYPKGTLVMYWLRELVGEDVVNRSLRQLLAEHGLRPAPYANTNDFFRGPAHEAAIDDLFERITLYDVKAKRALATRLPSGHWQLTLDVEARKLYADGHGKETEAPLDEPFDFGVFTTEPGKEGFVAASVLLAERHPLTSGASRFVFETESEPRLSNSLTVTTERKILGVNYATDAETYERTTIERRRLGYF
ncbi:aminopeptidase, partial [bacterium]